MTEPWPVVYPVRAGENESLRYALRTLANLNHGEVFIVGDAPSWVTNVNVIAGNRFETKQRNVFDNVRLACEHPDVPERFLMMNDDFFLLRPYSPMVEFRSRLTDHIHSLRTGQRCSWWEQSLRNTLACLPPEPAPLSYELHKPFIVERDKMREALDEVADFSPDNPPQWRTVYGNRWRIGGKQSTDCKVYARPGPGWHGWTLLSCNEQSFAVVRMLLAQRFPNPSPYEV